MRYLKDRGGHRQSKRNTRNEKTRSSLPGLYVVFVDAEKTEPNYFKGLRDSGVCSAQVSIKVLKARNAEKILEDVEKRPIQANASIWLVFDRDEVAPFDQIISEAEKQGYHVGWSNPCFEIWLHAYFGKMPSVQTSVECVENFKKEFKRQTEQEYKKNDPKIFNLVEKYGKFEIARDVSKKAMQAAKNVSSQPSKQSPATTVYKLVEELRGIND